MAARLWLYTASVYLLYGLLEQEASPFGEVGSVASRMLTTSLVAFVRDEPGALLALHRAHAGGDGHVAEHSRAASPVMCILARRARAQTVRVRDLPVRAAAGLGHASAGQRVPPGPGAGLRRGVARQGRRVGGARRRRPAPPRAHGATVRALGGMRPQAAHSLQVEHPRMALRVCSPSRCVSSVLEGVQHCSVQVAFQFCSNVKSVLDKKTASTT